MTLFDQLTGYSCVNAQEEQDRLIMLDMLQNKKNIFSRENKAAHFTASSWLVDSQGKKVLMAYHRIYRSWAWTGGHADGDEDLLRVAVREAKEESGLETVRPLLETPFSLEILTVDGHEKRGEYVSSHLHLNVTYLLTGDETQDIRCKADENSAVCWFTPEEALAECAEPWMNRRIYLKLIQKFARMKENGSLRF